MIEFTEAAAQQVKSLIEQHEPDAKGLKVFVQGGGCSGFSYGFDFMTEEDESDYLVVETDGIKLYVDAMSNMYLDGATVDFQTGIAGSSFTINNPNTTTTCGCGSSFSV